MDMSYFMKKKRKEKISHAFPHMIFFLLYKLKQRAMAGAIILTDEIFCHYYPKPGIITEKKRH
jgi:hypothetical protein